MFSVHTTPEEYENATLNSPATLVCVWLKLWHGEYHDYSNVVMYQKLCFRNVVRPQWNAKPSFSNSSCLKSVFQKLRFRAGLVWTVDLTEVVKLRFQIPPPCGRGLSCKIVLQSFSPSVSKSLICLFWFGCSIPFFGSLKVFVGNLEISPSLKEKKKHKSNQWR